MEITLIVVRVLCMNHWPYSTNYIHVNYMCYLYLIWHVSSLTVIDIRNQVLYYPVGRIRISATAVRWNCFGQTTACVRKCARHRTRHDPTSLPFQCNKGARYFYEEFGVISNVNCFPKTRMTHLGYAVAQLVEILGYNREGHGFDSRCCHWTFSLT